MKIQRSVLAAVALTTGLGVCGCSSSGGSSMVPGGADAAVSCGGHPGVPTTHRAAAVACTPSPLSASVFPDGGPSCGADSECADAADGPVCRQAKCSVDQCLVDSDCAAGSACGCADSYYGGNAEHANSCFTSNCRVDSDCGPGGYCSPSLGEYCGGLTGYYCHRAADTCANDADCSCVLPSGGTCSYQPTVGHWQCQARVVCVG